jgi:predicted RNA-binding Zn-ribbon protein involved in translation (DUF1610 family)
MKMQTAEGFSLQLVTNEPKKGFLGGFGLKEKLEPTAYVCPECGLIRSYAERDESE